jgi:pimeloyl-ACP methyl ester carboxylesterase
MKAIRLLLVLLATQFIQTQTAHAQPAGHYADVNGIHMYYEIHGTGNPLVLLHGGGSTIRTSFGRILPALAKTHQVIAIELQAHGHTGDRNVPETFEQDAADVVELLRQLNITETDILGFSNGGMTTLQIAIKYPGLLKKVVIASALYNRSGTPPGFWDGFATAKLTDMPQLYRDEYMSINHDQAGLQNMFNKDVQRMATFEGWSDDAIRSIQTPALVVAGDHDVATPEHTVGLYRLLPHARLSIFPAAHGEYMGEALFPDTDDKTPAFFVDLVNKFLAE